MPIVIKIGQLVHNS